MNIRPSELSELYLEKKVELEEDELEEVWDEFNEHVNMTASELERWSNNPCSREASKDPEAVIERNLRLLSKNKEDWTDEDIKDAKRTISFISRMTPNEPDEPRDGPHGCPSEWAISLLNWAFNPFDSLPEIPDNDDLEDVEKITMQAFKFEEDDKVKWDSSGGTAFGVIRDRTNDQCYDASIDGDVKVCGEEDDPAYLIELFDDEEEELTGTMVAHKESTLEEASFELSDSKTLRVNQGKIYDKEEKVFDSKEIKEIMEEPKTSSSDSIGLYPTDYTIENRQHTEQENNQFFRSNWSSVFKQENRPFAFQMHWMGLSEEQKDMSHEELIDASDVRVHGDLRMDIDSSNAFGFTTFEDRDDIEEKSVFIDALKRKNPNEDRIQGAWKEEFPEQWLDFGFDKPLIFEPGEQGATEDTFGKLFGIFTGTWTPGVVHKNSAEIFLESEEIDARAIISFVPLPNGEDTWMLSFPDNQTPEAERKTLDTKVSELKRSSSDHERIIWNNPNDDNGPRNINISRFNLSEDNVEEITVEEMNALWS